MTLLAFAAAALLSVAPGIAANGTAPPPTIPPAVLDDTLEVVGDSLDAQQSKTRMFVQAKVNGQGPFRFLVDSGADRSVIGTGLAQRLALPPGRRVKLRGMAGTAQVDTVLIDSLAIGSSEINGIAAPALSERYLGAQGLLGIDALAEQRLMLDFDAKKIIFQDTHRAAPVVSDEIVVTARRRNGQLILTQVATTGARIFAVIDTGSEVTLGNLALQERVFRGRSAPATRPVTLVSVTGQSIVANLATLPEMRIGNITLNNVVVAFVDAPPFALFGLDKQPAMLLGTDVLQAFRRVSLDFRNRKVRFVLRR